MVAAARSRTWPRWVHWIGYVAAAIVILPVILLGGVFLKSDLERRAETRMGHGSFAARFPAPYDPHDTELISARMLLDELPAPEAIEPDGLRFVAMPSFGDAYFAISIRRNGDGAEALVMIVPPKPGASVPAPVRVALDPARYRALTASLDQRAADFPGDTDWWLDGTTIIYERVANGQVMSGYGNSEFYGDVGALVLRALRPAVPQLSRYDESWRPREQSVSPAARGS